MLQAAGLHKLITSANKISGKSTAVCRTFFAGFCALHGSPCESVISDSSLVPPLLDSLAALNTLPPADSLALLLPLPESDALALVAAAWLVRVSKLGCMLTRAAFGGLFWAAG